MSWFLSVLVSIEKKRQRKLSSLDMSYVVDQTKRRNGVYYKEMKRRRFINKCRSSLLKVAYEELVRGVDGNYLVCVWVDLDMKNMVSVVGKEKVGFGFGWEVGFKILGGESGNLTLDYIFSFLLFFYSTIFLKRLQ